jgi:hypothetical protein
MRLSFLATIVLAACATTAPKKLGDRGPTATEHLEEAREHGQIAAERWRWPESRPDGTGAIGGQPDARWSPWFYFWDPAIDHERMAEAHRAAAAQLEAEYQAACGDRPAAEVAVSPIQRWAIGGTNTGDGAILYLSRDAGTPEQLLGTMRCYRAWMMLGRTHTDDDPLALDDVQVVVHPTGSAIEVLLTTRAEKLVPELQRRAAAAVENAAQRRGPD